MRKEIELALYEIKNGIFPEPFSVSLDELVHITIAVEKRIKSRINRKKFDYGVIRFYLEKWNKLVI